MKSSPAVTVALALLVIVGYASAQSSLAEKAQRAKELMAAGRAAEAAPLYRDLVSAIPNNPGLLLNLGLALDLSGKKRDAITQYGAVLKIDPNSFPALLLMGTAYMDLGEPSKALPPLQTAEKLQPGNLQAEGTLADADMGVNRFADAARIFQQLSMQDPSNAKAWYGLGSAYEGLAQQNFDALTEVGQGSGYWLDLVAESRLETKQTYSAFYFYRQALEKMPSLRGAHAAIAEVYQQTGHADWAPTEQAREAQLPAPDCSVQRLECEFLKGEFQVIVADGKKSPETFYWKTRACNRLALDAYTHLAQLPPSQESYELQARLASKRRQYAEATKELQEALKLSPGSPQIKRELAVALYRSGSLDEAQSLFRDLLQLDRDSTELNYLLGDTLLNSQKPQEAIVYLQKAVAHDAKFPVAEKSLGVAYLQMGQAERAIPHLRAALASDEDGSVHYQLGRAYQAHGDRELARNMFKQYQEAKQKNEAESQAVEKEVSIAPP